MPTVRSIVNEARFKVMQKLLQTDILLAQAEYTRLYLSLGQSEQVQTVLMKLHDMNTVKRKSLGTSSFEDRNDDARDVRVAALERMYEQRVSDAFLYFQAPGVVV